MSFGSTSTILHLAKRVRDILPESTDDELVAKICDLLLEESRCSNVDLDLKSVDSFMVVDEEDESDNYLSPRTKDMEYSSHLKEDLPKYWEIYNKWNDQRKFYCTKDLEKYIDVKVIPVEQLGDVDVSVDIMRSCANLLHHDKAAKLDTTNYVCDSKVLVNTINREYGLGTLFEDSKFAKNFCISGGSVFKAIAGIKNTAEDNSDVDIYPINCTNEMIHEGVHYAICYMRNHKKHVRVLRSAYAITIQYSNKIIPHWISDAYDSLLNISQIYRTTNPFKSVFHVMKYCGDDNMSTYDIGTILCAQNEPDEQTLHHIFVMREYLKNAKDVAFKAINEYASNLESLTPTERLSIQFILVNTRTVDEIHAMFDIDCCCASVYKGQCFISERFRHAMITKSNVINPGMSSPSYAGRLVKYAKRGIDIYVPNLAIDQILPWDGVKDTGVLYSVVHMMSGKYTSYTQSSDYDCIKIVIADECNLFAKNTTYGERYVEFPDALLHSDYSCGMVGLIHPSDGKFYTGSYKAIESSVDNDESVDE